MLPIKAFRIFYADGSSYDSTQGTWAQAPPFGVQCVVRYHDPPYKTLEQGRDLYTMEGEEGHKLGLWMDAAGFYRVQDLAMRSTLPEP